MRWEAGRMRLRESRTMGLLLAAGVLVGGANLAAYGATGGNFLLGRANKANQTSTLTNTGTGPALKLGSRAGAPPLAVTSSKKVAKLNSDLLDGKDSTAFERKIPALVWHSIPTETDNNWVACESATPPAYAVRNAIVYWKGRICASGDPIGDLAMIVPAAGRPVRETDEVLLPAILTIGTSIGLRLSSSDGGVLITAEFSLSDKIISLEGISYPK